MRKTSPGFFKSSYKAPLRGALGHRRSFRSRAGRASARVEKDARAGRAPAPAAPAESDLRAPERLAIDYANATDLAEKAGKALKGDGGQSARGVESAARTRHLPRTWPGTQGCVPLHRPRFAVREHAQAAAAPPNRLSPRLLPKPIA